MCQYKLDAEVVLKAAAGHWEGILRMLAPSLEKALDAAPKHVACPIHGGENGFRFFKDYAKNGSCICNTCGAFDGLHILMKVNNWDFFTALKAVSNYLQMPEGVTPVSDVKTTEGRVTTLGTARLRNGASCFRLTLKLTDGSEKSVWGTDLQRAASEAGIRTGDNAAVSKLGVRTFTVRGRTVTKTLWSVKRLPGDAERREAERKAREEASRRESAIASRWDYAQAYNPKNPLQQPLVNYLESRGIRPTARKGILTDLRFIPDEAYRTADGTIKGKFPCMVCAVRNAAGELVTLHRTFLTREGRKIPFGIPKKLMALPEGRTINGAFIQFGPVTAEGIVCVAEGVETALSVVKATGYPCISAISANGMTSVELPAATKVVFIFADKDASQTGQKAAEALRTRLTAQGIPCVICLPYEDIPAGSKGVDWNDVLTRRGPSAFPFHRGSVLV